MSVGNSMISKEYFALLFLLISDSGEKFAKTTIIIVFTQPSSTSVSILQDTPIKYLSYGGALQYVI